MQRRTKLAIVILAGILLLLLGLWLFLQPLLQNRSAAQPPELPANPTAREPETGTRQREAPIPPTPAPEAKPTAQSGILALQNHARELTSRILTGTADNGFAGFQDAIIDATVNGRAALSAGRKTLQAQHPPGTPYGQTAKAVTATVDSGAYGGASIVISMDVYAAENAGTPGIVTKTSTYKATMTFAKQGDGTYLMEDFTWKPSSGSGG